MFLIVCKLLCGFSRNAAFHFGPYCDMRLNSLKPCPKILSLLSLDAKTKIIAGVSGALALLSLLLLLNIYR